MPAFVDTDGSGPGGPWLVRVLMGVRSGFLFLLKITHQGIVAAGRPPVPVRIRMR
ncbi:hypothetical protein [Streptomyces sp. NPDC051561]|uniref:hypothetical protein n=1 Tax=Streptomyces sp. NPDC051561 TaxID=3365658 RepID=UPI00378BBFA1